MSKLDGLVQSFSSPHPQPMIEILYEEIFDQYEARDEIDVVIAYKRSTDENSITIKDFRVTRVNQSPADGFETGGDYVAYLKLIDAWARSVEGADRYLLAHKHVEGMAYPSDSDLETSEVLSTIDYARSEPGESDSDDPFKYKNTGWFYGMAILNRERSFVVGATNRPVPIEDREIDTAVFERMAAIILRGAEIAEKETGWTKAHELREHIANIRQILSHAFDAFETETVSEEEAIAQWEQVAAEMEIVTALGREMHKMILKARGLKPRLTPEELMARLQDGDPDAVRKLLDELGLKTNVVYKLGPDGLEEMGEGSMEDLVPDATHMVEVRIPKENKPDPDMFPILGRPAVPAPKQAIAADHTEPAPAEERKDEDERPDVPDAFRGIEIDYL